MPWETSRSSPKLKTMLGVGLRVQGFPDMALLGLVSLGFTMCLGPSLGTSFEYTDP